MPTMQDWNVLIVEDELDGQEVVKEILSYFNIAGYAVGTAEEAIDLLQHQNYNAAVIDLGLPGIDGIELVKYIRDQDMLRDLPCVAITAYHSSQLKQEAFEAGFDAYFPKPLDDTSFMRELDRVIANR